MQQFIAGFIVAVLAAAAVAVLLFKRGSRLEKSEGAHLQQLEELSKLTGQLAHEIKNPLSTIKINMKLAAEELQALGSAESGGASRALRKISVIQKEADRLEQILNGFLRYVDKTELQLANIDINELVGDMVDFYSPQAHSHSITMRLTLNSEPLVCKVDCDMLKQVMLNLLINAQQAMENGGELMIRTERQDKDAVIFVSDTGSGIAPEKVSKIFDAYYSSRPQGSGLGLPTAKKIVEAHKGEVTVDSEEGKGTLFTVRLPLCS